MNAIWQVQEAKNRFSEMIEQALTCGPQVITRHGRAVAQVVATQQSERATSPSASAAPPDADDGFAAYLLAAPRGDGLQVPLRRSCKSALVRG